MTPVLGPYLTLVVFLIASLVVARRDFQTAPGLDKALPLGRVALAIPIAVFGAEHFAFRDAIVKTIPPWMPAKLFWTYFVGIALIAAALSILFRVRMRLSAALLGIMLFCFVAMIHLPNAIAAPGRIPWTLVARESSFGSGAILLAIAGGARKPTPAENRIAAGALYCIAAVTLFFGVEQLLHPDHVPAVPLEKMTPLWIPLAHFWTVLTGIAMVAGACAMLGKRHSRAAAAALGAWVVLLVATFYCAMMVAQRDIEGLNYFADTLMFGSILLLASCAYEVPRAVTPPRAESVPGAS